MPETYENGSKSACAPTLAKPGNSWFETAGSRVVGMSEWDRIVLDKVDDVDWPGGGYSCFWEVRQVVRQRGGMSQLKLLDESRRWGRQSAAVGGREDQYGRGEQQAAWRCAVVLRLDRVVHGKRLGSHRRCSERLKYEGVATSLSGVLPEERCKVGSADDGGGVYVGHERCGGRSWRRDG